MILMGHRADEYTMRALNGSRVADAIKDVVAESGSSLETFRLALRTIKLWAAVRAGPTDSCGNPPGSPPTSGMDPRAATHDPAPFLCRVGRCLHDARLPSALAPAVCPRRAGVWLPP